MLSAPLFPPANFVQWVKLWVSPLSVRKVGWTIRITFKKGVKISDLRGI